MAAATPAALQHGLGDLAAARWGTRPELEIEQGEDVTDPAALGVVLVAIGLQAPDAGSEA